MIGRPKTCPFPLHAGVGRPGHAGAALPLDAELRQRVEGERPAWRVRLS